MSTVAMVAACGGGGGGSSSTPPPPPPGSAITISGTARYDSVPAQSSGAGLNYDAITQKPIRGATVQLLDSAGNALATTVTDAQGAYSFDTTSNQALRVRVRAELKDTDPANGMWDMTVRDNTSTPGDALYVLDSAQFTPTASETHNLLAGSGWGGSSYTGTRAAAPFAVLDVAYQGLQKVLSAAPNVSLPALQLFWSKNNVPSTGDRSQGQIGTSSYVFANNTHRLYLLGTEDVDTDEYDSHVVEHEFGHYLQRALSEDDNIGGSHGRNDRLDMRVAFSEGWGNGWSGIALNDPRYTDSIGSQQQTTGVLMNVNDAPSSNQGWYSEATAQYLVWSLNADASIGFTPIYNALTALRGKKPFTSLYSFGVAMKNSGASSATVDSLWQGQSIFGTDEYGSGETNFSTITVANPVYQTHTAAAGVAQQYCISSTAGTYNKLGNSVFVRFNTTAGNHTLTLVPASATGTDPDFYVVTSAGTRLQGRSTTTDSESQTFSFPEGEHVAALADFQLTISGVTRCFNFTVN